MCIITQRFVSSSRRKRSDVIGPVSVFCRRNAFPTGRADKYVQIICLGCMYVLYLE